MLFERWREIARSRPQERALRDVSSGRSWTFKELAAEAEAGPTESSKVVFPHGMEPEFVLTLLRGWRDGAIVCPLEERQASPEITGGLPAGTVHLKTTSATTGNARLVAFTGEQLFADADQIVRTMGLRADWPNLAVISLAHSYGFSNLVLPLLLHGIPLVLAGSALPEALRRAAQGESHLTLAGVPALWHTWHDSRALPSNIQLAISAGAPLSLALEQAVYRESGLKIHNFYGSSECGGIAYDRSLLPRADASYAGSAMEDVSLSVADDGCLEVRSAAVGLAYWPEPSEKLGNGVFRTGDLGEIVEGQVYLRGRATDRINVAGRKVSPEVIEKVLSGHPAVRECVVFGVPVGHGHRGERIVACVGLRSGSSGEELKQFILSKLPSWQVPRDWWFLQGRLSNVRGKVPRAEWRSRYLNKDRVS